MTIKFTGRPASLALVLMLQDHEIPEHIKQTFHLHQQPADSGTGRTWASDIADYDVVTIGQQYDLRASTYLIVYQADEWHYSEVQHYESQIKSMVQNAIVAIVPVVLDPEPEPEKDTPVGTSLGAILKSFSYTFPGGGGKLVP